MIDVWVDVPNLSARQVERKVTIPLEKLLKQVPGIEHIYFASNDGAITHHLIFTLIMSFEEWPRKCQLLFKVYTIPVRSI
jgi:multidrug efflux pump subunit AcrB